MPASAVAASVRAVSTKSRRDSGMATTPACDATKTNWPERHTRDETGCDPAG
jgi:hypothetical protein